MPAPRDIVTPLKDGAYVPDYETLRRIVWLHWRHTSVTYIARMLEMLDIFTEGFAIYVKKSEEPGSFAEFLRTCLECSSELKDGLVRLRKADLTGFRRIREAMRFYTPFYSETMERNFDPLGYKGYQKPGVALWAWIEKIIPMSQNIEWTLWGQLSHPSFDISEYHIPDQIGGYPLAGQTFIKDGEDIPFTGIWQPISLKSGCPNFLIRGEKAPKAILPIRRIDTPEWDEKWPNGRINHHKARSIFEVGEFPTVWQLVCEDDRWRDGREPLGEQEYLEDPATANPAEPPVALRDPPKFPSH